MEPFAWETEPIEPLNQRIGRQMLNGDAMTLARITLAQGAVVPEHSHPNEQIGMLVVAEDDEPPLPQLEALRDLVGREPDLYEEYEALA